MTQENLYTPNCIRTYTGIYFNVLEPTIDMIDIRDIAHGLSLQCRFGAQLPAFYSVAEHSIEVAYHSCDKMAGLLHDASEAYLLDIPTPVKKLITGYYEIEGKIMKLIAEKFHFSYPLPDDVKAADKLMLEREWYNVFINSNWTTKTPRTAERVFLQLFKKLSTPAER